MTNFEELIKNELSEKRYIHSLGVAKLAKSLAKAHGLDEDKAYLSGILHDITKEKSEDFHDALFLKHHDEDKIKELKPIKHSHSAKYYLMDEFGIDDEELLEAIYNHTICKSNSDYAKILYIADKREENRKIYDDIVPLSLKNIDEGYQALLLDVERFIKNKEKLNGTSKTNL